MTTTASLYDSSRALSLLSRDSEWWVPALEEVPQYWDYSSPSQAASSPAPGPWENYRCPLGNYLKPSICPVGTDSSVLHLLGHTERGHSA